MNVSDLFSINHSHNNESMLADAKRINAKLGLEASNSINEKLLYILSIMYTTY